ncbi:MAG: ABC transporter ATP-binding protein [Acidobacteriota bacterium]
MGNRASGLHVRIRQVAPIPIDADLRCGPGEVLALVGPSGSGKSTILRCIAGLHAPADGRITCGSEVWFDGEAGVRRSAGMRRVGLVFQSYALFPHLTALDNVREGMDDPDAASARGAARALLARVNLSGLEHRLPRQLSAGQQQRVAMARALARDPAVLLLDEPFSAVDRVTREKLYGELAGLRRDLNMPVILVTHDLDEAVMLADAMTLVSHGRTLQYGTPLEVMHRPVSAEVARLVGLRNVFAGSILAHDRQRGSTFVAWEGHRLEVALRDRIPIGTRVSWAVPSSGVLLMARDRPAGPLDNLIEARVGRLVHLGDQVRVVAWVDNEVSRPMSLAVPRHLAERYALAEGASLRLRLRGDAIHLMPGE